MEAQPPPKTDNVKEEEEKYKDQSGLDPQADEDYGFEAHEPIEPKPFLAKKGNYNGLIVYKKAECIFDITFYFSPLGLSNGFNVSCDVVYDEATTVGINSMAASKQNETIYNLQGVRLNKLQKGLNIVGGKKIVVR
jgi:hypothetical protein